MIIIIDYKLGNLYSVLRACQKVGLDAKISSDPAELKNCSAAILPGVGAFGCAMQNMLKCGLTEGIHSHVLDGKPLFGICLGLQLLFEESEEFGSPKGLGLLKGRVRKLPIKSAPVPQIGWNRIELPDEKSTWYNSPMQSVDPGSWMYFVHSYYADNEDSLDRHTLTEYAGFKYTSTVLRNNIFATQFHPEKSSEHGLSIYREWKNLIERK